jgi:hypothetical protein
VEQELQDRVARAAGMDSREELLRVHKEIVDFHGEMVLLENYSALNYTGEHFHFLPPFRSMHGVTCTCCYAVSELLVLPFEDVLVVP